jgi:hypothetical protein
MGKAQLEAIPNDLYASKEIRLYPVKSMEPRPSGETEYHARRRREALRRRYRPADIRLLFIGEAPPASGRFFYQRNSGLYRAIRNAFLSLDPSLSDESFLDAFQGAGCYLIDLCPHPVDLLDSKSRGMACSASEALLSRNIRKLQPRALVTLLRRIRDNVNRSISSAGWHGPLIEAPYPGRWVRHREIFLAALAPQLEAIAKEGRWKAVRNACAARG